MACLQDSFRRMGMVSPSNNPLDSHSRVSDCDPLTKMGSMEGQVLCMSHSGNLRLTVLIPLTQSHRVGQLQGQGQDQKPGLSHPGEWPGQVFSCIFSVQRSRKRNVKHGLWATGFTRSHRVTVRWKQKGKKNTFTVFRRCAACLHRLFAPHHNCDKMLFSFQWCAQVPIQINIIRTLLSNHCELFKGWLHLWYCCFISSALLGEVLPPMTCPFLLLCPSPSTLFPQRIQVSLERMASGLLGGGITGILAYLWFSEDLENKVQCGHLVCIGAGGGGT